MDDMLNRRYWKRISPATQDDSELLENIGSLALKELHGDVLHCVIDRLGRVLHRQVASDLPEVVARVIIRLWREMDLSWMLPADYEGLVELCSDVSLDVATESDA